MSTPNTELDKYLQALFGRLDTGTDFDTRLMARLRAESHSDASGRVLRARQQEQARYRSAVLELRSWRRSMLRLLTLDTLGIALLLVVAVVTAWPRFSGDVMDSLRRYGPYVLTLLALLIAAVPLMGMWAEQTRKPLRLL